MNEPVVPPVQVLVEITITAFSDGNCQLKASGNHLQADPGIIPKLLAAQLNLMLNPPQQTNASRIIAPPAGVDGNRLRV